MPGSLSFSLIVICTIFARESWGKPAENLLEIQQVIPIPASDVPNSEIARQQRSPQFGLLDADDDYDYSSEEDYTESRHFSGHKHKFHKHKPLGLHGGHGAYGGHEGHGGHGGWRPDHGEHHNAGHGFGQSGSFASASAGSSGNGGGHNGGHSEANSQSASFSFGPYTASFSVAHASSGSNSRY